MRKRQAALRIAALVCVAMVGYGIGRAHASGIPSVSPLNYAGTLLNNGQPATSPQTIEIRFYDQQSGGTQLCDVPAASTTLDSAGRFSIPLADSCTQAIHTHQDVYVEIDVAGTTVGNRAKLGAVPYSVESDHAVTADDATDGGPLATLLSEQAHNTFYGTFPPQPTDGGYIRVDFPKYPNNTTWLQVPGTLVSFTATHTSTVELRMDGEVDTVGNSSTDEFSCDFDFLFDGQPLTQASDGDAYFAGSVGSTTESSATISATRVLTNVAPGPHTVGIQVNNGSAFGTIATCFTDSANPTVVTATVR